MNDLPPELPNIRVPTQQLDNFYGPAAPAALEDRDNFVRDLGTLLGYGSGGVDDGGDTPAPPVTPTPSARDREPVLTVPEIKAQCHIELDQTYDDDYLKQLEMAARLHTENVLRYEIDTSVGENIKQALLILIAHWYRNREALLEGRWLVAPLAYTALVSPERDYPTYT